MDCNEALINEGAPLGADIYSTQSSKNLFAETSEACFARFGVIFGNDAVAIDLSLLLQRKTRQLPSCDGPNSPAAIRDQNTKQSSHARKQCQSFHRSHQRNDRGADRDDGQARSGERRETRFDSK